MKQAIFLTALALLVVAGLLWLVAGIGDRVRAGIVTIHPAPETTRELIIVERRWFGSDRITRVEIRNIDGRPEWAMKDKQGRWTQAFNFAEPEYYSGLDQ